MPPFVEKFFDKLKLYKKEIIAGFLLVSLFFASAAISYFCFTFSKVFVKRKEPEITQPTESRQSAFDTLDTYNILLLGYGGAGHEGGTLSDTIIVTNVNKDRGKVTFISVPRDLWVEIPVRSDLRQYHKINAAYAIGFDDTRFPLKEPQYKGEEGAALLAKEVVGEAVGMPIKYFVAISFDGFKEAIDILEGIEVDVPVTFDDYFYPIKGRENDTCGKSASEIATAHQLYSDTELHHQFECRYEHIHFDAGTASMDGETALKFVRSRASAQHGGDFARAERQQAVLFAIKNKLISLGALDDAIPFFNKLSSTIRTDVDGEIIKDVIGLHKDMAKYSVSTVSLSEENVLVSTKSLDGQFILIPKEGEGIWSGIHNFVKEQIGTH